MELEGTPGAYRLRYELPVASVGPVRRILWKNAIGMETVDNYKNNATGKKCWRDGGERMEMEMERCRW